MTNDEWRMTNESSFAFLLHGFHFLKDEGVMANIGGISNAECRMSNWRNFAIRTSHFALRTSPDAAVRQLVSKAITTDGQVIDVFTAAGCERQRRGTCQPRATPWVCVPV